LPAQLKLAFYDAAQGRSRSFMNAVQRLCYAYDPQGRTYVLQINRLILGATGLLALGFVVFLVRSKRRPAAEPPKPSEENGSDA